jgi:hypothetical protein
MGIPNLANRRSRGQERQSRCKLAMPNLAIHLGYHSACRHATAGRHIATPVHLGVYRQRLQANRVDDAVS